MSRSNLFPHMWIPLLSQYNILHIAFSPPLVEKEQNNIKQLDCSIFFQKYYILFTKWLLSSSFFYSFFVVCFWKQVTIFSDSWPISPQIPWFSKSNAENYLFHGWGLLIDICPLLVTLLMVFMIFLKNLRLNSRSLVEFLDGLVISPLEVKGNGGIC